MIFFIPGWVVAIVTFPGVIVHEIAHRFFCDLFKVRVYRCFYFIPFSEQAGLVLSESTDNLAVSFWIGYGPLFINTFLSLICCFPFYLSHAAGAEYILFPSTFFYIITWVGFSIGIQAIPSSDDMRNTRYLLDKYQKEVSPVISACIIMIDIFCRGVNYCSYIGGSFLYTIIVNFAFAKIVLLACL